MGTIVISVLVSLIAIVGLIRKPTKPDYSADI